MFNEIDEEKLKQCFNVYIFEDEGMRENTVSDILKRVKATFSNKRYLENLETSKKNWIGVPNKLVTSEIVNGIQALL